MVITVVIIVAEEVLDDVVVPTVRGAVRYRQQQPWGKMMEVAGHVIGM